MKTGLWLRPWCWWTSLLDLSHLYVCCLHLVALGKPKHYRLLVISSNQDRRQTAHARTALTASACLVWVLLRASWFSALSVKILCSCVPGKIRETPATSRV